MIISETNNIAAFLVDLDGTLLGRDEKIAPRVEEAIRHLSKRLPVCIATGREPKDALNFSRQLRLTTPQICDNGALILDPITGNQLWSAPIGQGNAKDVVDAMVSRQAVILATHPGGTVTSPDEISRWDVTRVSTIDVVESLADELIVQFEAHQELQAVKAYLPYNGLWAVNFTAKGVTKGTAAERLGRILGCGPADMIAAGDSYNDMPMFEACGLNIAMKEAPDELKALADYIAPSVDEDGLAVAVEEFVLPMLS